MNGDGRQWETEVGTKLVDLGLTIATAESCTGGLIGHLLTNVSGSSAYYVGGLVAYAYAVKTRELGIDPGLLDRLGAVSEPVARQMASRVRETFRADVGVATTGIAGPTGGTPDKPVGLVYIAVCDGAGCRVECRRFEGRRTEIKEAAAQAALKLVWECLPADAAAAGGAAATGRPSRSGNGLDNVKKGEG